MPRQPHARKDINPVVVVVEGGLCTGERRDSTAAGRGRVATAAGPRDMRRSGEQAEEAWPVAHLWNGRTLVLTGRYRPGKWGLTIQ